MEIRGGKVDRSKGDTVASLYVQEKVSHDLTDHSFAENWRHPHTGPRIRVPTLGTRSDMTCIARNPAAEPFMFATGSQIWTTPEIPTRPAFPIPRSDAAEQGAVDLSVPVLREPSHRYIPMRVQDSTNT
jgi:hypothetical protein